MSKGGRTRDPIRVHVTFASDNQKYVTCNYCDHRFFNQVRTMRSHLSACKEVTDDTKILIDGIIAKSEQIQ